MSGFSFLIIAFLSPLLSGIADYTGNKKIFMKFFVYMGSISCIGLYWFELETIEISLVFYVLALIGFWGSLVYYNSYLTDITYPKQTNMVSARGFAMGYIGSVSLLLLNLIMINYYESFGFTSEINAMKLSFAIVGVWWLGFSQYSFYHLPKGNKGAIINSNFITNKDNNVCELNNPLIASKTLRLSMTGTAIIIMSTSSDVSWFISNKVEK